MLRCFVLQAALYSTGSISDCSDCVYFFIFPLFLCFYRGLPGYVDTWVLCSSVLVVFIVHFSCLVVLQIPSLYREFYFWKFSGRFMRAVMPLQLHHVTGPWTDTNQPPTICLHGVCHWFSFSFGQRQRKCTGNKLYLLCVFCPVSCPHFFLKNLCKIIWYVSLLQLLSLFFSMTQVQHRCTARPLAGKSFVLLFQMPCVKSCSDAPECVRPFWFIVRCKVERESEGGPEAGMAFSAELIRRPVRNELTVQDRMHLCTSPN